ncbi:MAG: hypothetical protein PHE94_01970 [Eubacteriales bacterium]|nr:hypothetical protein [Eubacteriales bacterium]
MNPALIPIIVLLMSQGSHEKLSLPLSPRTVGKSGIPQTKDLTYFNDFQMELLLDKLHNMTNTLEKINHLNQLKSVPMNGSNSIERIQESLDAVRGLLYNSKSTRLIDSLSKTLSGVQRLGDMKGIMSNMEPILSLLTENSDNNADK